jgi:hypothetical protein
MHQERRGEMGVETWRTLLHYKQDSPNVFKDTNKSSLFIISLHDSFFLHFFHFFFPLWHFFSFRYRHATRHRWFVTTESYLVVAWGSVWCFAKCKGSLALFSFAACDDKTTEKAKEEERK